MPPAEKLAKRLGSKPKSTRSNTDRKPKFKSTDTRESLQEIINNSFKTDSSPTMLTKSGQAEILRASQKDESFLVHFHELFTDILQGILGIRTWIRFREGFKICSNMLYYCLTTLSNTQTLGEEYTGIFQVNSTGTGLQKKHVQLLMVILSTCGEKAITDSLKQFEKYVTNLPKNHSLTPQAREKLVTFSENLREIIPFLQKVHKAIFYLNGDYYQIGKRMTGTRYVLIRHWLKDTTSLRAFRVLGVVSFIHLALNFVFTVMKENTLKDAERKVSRTNQPGTWQNRCPLCLNPYQNTSAIPCGHLFCWECIVSWLQERPQCPLCRRWAQPSRVIYVQDYKKP